MRSAVESTQLAGDQAASSRGQRLRCKSTSRSRKRREHAWLNGYTVFAVAVMFVLGLWQFLAGLTAVVRDGLYAAPPGYTYSFNVAGWGWLVLLLGVLIAGTAVV